MSEYRRKWTEEEDSWLREHYPDTPMEEMVVRLNRSPRAIYSRALNYLGVRRSKEMLREINRQGQAKCVSNPGRFQKGSVPFCKGVPRSEWMSAEGEEKCAKTQFKKGNKPHNTRTEGHETLRSSGYVWVKVGDKMVLKHRHVWEEQHGAIPKGYNMQFKDGNRQNCSIENLYLISRADQLSQQNSFHRYPAELKTAIRSLGKLNKAIKENEQQSNKHR